MAPARQVQGGGGTGPSCASPATSAGACSLHSGASGGTLPTKLFCSPGRFDRLKEEECYMNLKLSTRTVDGVAVVDCTGRIVFGEESIALREQVKNLLAENRKQLVINLGGVTYIDSGGLGTLVGLYTSARSAGGSVKLARLTHRVGELLQVTKLLTVFEVFENEDQAIRSYRKTAVA